MSAKKVIFIIFILLLITTFFMSQKPTDENKTPENNDELLIELPSLVKEGEESLEEVISERRSIRNYQDEPLTLKEVSQILWAAQGITDPASNFRAVPSAGALYPLSIYINASNVEGLDSGLYQYLVDDHKLSLKTENNLKDKIYNAALQQSSIKESGVTLIIAADYEITEARYDDRAERYVHMEAGHAGQNIYLQTTTLGLGTVAIGAFNDDEMKDILGIEKEPIYIFPVGKRMK